MKNVAHSSLEIQQSWQPNGRFPQKLSVIDDTRRLRHIPVILIDTERDRST